MGRWYDGWALGNELGQVLEEWPGAMDLVESLGHFAGQSDAALGDDPEPCFFEAGVDLAGQVATRSVRLDDGQCLLGSHLAPASLGDQRRGVIAVRRRTDNRIGKIGRAHV